MIKPDKIHDKGLWDKFVKESEHYFAVLNPDTKIAFFVGETDKNFLLIERKEGVINSKFNVNSSINMMETDLFFTVAEDDALELLDDASKLSSLIEEGKLGIFCLVDDVVMAEKGLDTLLNNLGFKPSCAI
ncbi:hypothetical protein SAMN02910297_00096 [Methanobrevibacter olleyae]|uniref:Uncharacterized protein n=1 Tax=Methanobrevibacter olleyae TaxID=294671 RepID=A0A1I4FFG0_METOL|nr:hypothetical protein [Methanobrevibacter olleyae]SFL16684.1 hypothetical protein SAMN02910297_00096 [Methanobrevibacter olleyae]